MRVAINYIIVGIIITFFNFNIGSINLLPAFLGYILIGVGTFKTIKNQYYEVVNWLPWVIALYQFIILFLNQDKFHAPIGKLVTVLFLVADMCLCFYIILNFYKTTNIKELITKQKIYLIITLLSIISVCFSINIPNLELVVAVIGIIGKLYFIFVLIFIKKNIIKESSDN